MGGEAAPGLQGTDGPVTTLSTTFGEWLERVPCIITLVQVITVGARSCPAGARVEPWFSGET
jgi:hypothetical protein